MRRIVGESVCVCVGCSLLVLSRTSSSLLERDCRVLSFIYIAFELKSVFNMQLLLSSVYGLFLFLLLSPVGSEYVRDRESELFTYPRNVECVKKKRRQSLQSVYAYYQQ